MAVAEVPFDLVEGKLAAPVARQGTAAKTDVIARLLAAPVPAVTVVAPAGYGKTTLLAWWAEADPRPFAWVALDPADDDALVFLRYITAAIHRVAPVPVEAFHALSGPGGSTLSKRVPPVGRALAALEHPLVLVLDDLHAIRNPACLDALAALLGYLPGGSQIAIASREEPDLPLARWRTRGLIHEIGVGDLRLDEQEAARLLEATGVELDQGELAELTERTEGWPAGLYLAALALQSGAPSSGSGAGVAGDDRFVAEYFRFELLSRLPPLEARFLQYTSVLERMCGPLCDAVLQVRRSAATLEALERTNGFVVPLDRHGEWYRYHHLFAELLRRELERSEPGVVQELNRRAMAWCIANGMTEAAIVYGHAAGEKDIVAGLLDAVALPLYYDGRKDTLEEWLSWFDDDDLTRYPALAVIGGWVLLLTGRPAEAERWLALAEGTTSRIPLSDGSATIEPWVAHLRAGLMPDGVEQGIADADVALEQLSPQSGWRPVAFAVRGVARALLDMTEPATEDLLAAVESGLAFGSVDVVYFAYAQLALLAAKRGGWREAAHYAQAAQAKVDSSGLGDYSSSALVHVTTARVALHEGRSEDARAAISRAHRLRPLLDHGVPWLTIPTGLELTRVHLALGDADAARTVLTEAEGVLELRPRMGSLIDDARELRARVEATSGSAGAWAMSLTGAELRLLPYLATHLTFPEIAGRLFISRNTVKTEAVSIYRKFGVASRSAAIERAVEVGLLESSIYPPSAALT